MVSPMRGADCAAPADDAADESPVVPSDAGEAERWRPCPPRDPRRRRRFAPPSGGDDELSAAEAPGVAPELSEGEVRSSIGGILQCGAARLAADLRGGHVVGAHSTRRCDEFGDARDTQTRDKDEERDEHDRVMLPASNDVTGDRPNATGRGLSAYGAYARSAQARRARNTRLTRTHRRK